MLGNIGAALMLAQDMMLFNEQKEMAKDTHLNETVDEITRRFEATAADRAKSSAQVRLTKVFGPGLSWPRPLLGFLSSCSASTSRKMV